MSMIGNCLKLSAAELAAILNEPEKTGELAYPEDGGAPGVLDLDKSWHLIHFLLTGEAWGGEPPLGNVVLGGKELEETDAGYGPFRYLTPPEVRDVSEALAQIPVEELWRRFDVNQVQKAEIYPRGWTGNEMERKYVSGYYEALCSYFSIAAASGSAMLLYLA